MSGKLPSHSRIESSKRGLTRDSLDSERGTNRSTLRKLWISLMLIALLLQYKRLLSTMDGRFSQLLFGVDRDDDRPITSTNSTQRIGIPKRLIFTYKYNLIDPSDGDPPYNDGDPLTANVLNTIDKYKQHWDGEHVAVSFLSNKDCTKVIEKAEPLLVGYFQREERGDFKADICRIADLYVSGGYYFDVDLSVVEPLNLDELTAHGEELVDPIARLGQFFRGDKMNSGEEDVVTFATVINYQSVFFQAFMAAMPDHPMLKLALRYMVAYYEDSLQNILPGNTLQLLTLNNKPIASRRKTLGLGLGPYTLAAAYLATEDQEWDYWVQTKWRGAGYKSSNNDGKKAKSKTSYSRFLYETSLRSKNITDWNLFQDIPLQGDSRKKGLADWCNYVCFGLTMTGPKVYFYSRIPGSTNCPSGQSQ